MKCPEKVINMKDFSYKTKKIVKWPEKAYSLSKESPEFRNIAATFRLLCAGSTLATIIFLKLHTLGNLAKKKYFANEHYCIESENLH